MAAARILGRHPIRILFFALGMCLAVAAGLFPQAAHSQQIAPALFELGISQTQTSYIGRSNSLIDPRAGQTLDFTRKQLSYGFFGFNSAVKDVYIKTTDDDYGKIEIPKPGGYRWLNSYFFSWNFRPGDASKAVGAFQINELLRQDSTFIFQMGFKHKRLRKKGSDEFRLINYSAQVGVSRHALAMPANRLAGQEMLPGDSIVTQGFNAWSLTLAFEWAPDFIVKRGGGSLSPMNLFMSEQSSSNKMPAAFAFMVRPFVQLQYLQPQDTFDLILDSYLRTPEKQTIAYLLYPGLMVDFTYDWLTFYLKGSYPLNAGNTSNKIPGLTGRGPDINFGFAFSPGFTGGLKRLRKIFNSDANDNSNINEDLLGRLRRLKGN